MPVTLYKTITIIIAIVSMAALLTLSTKVDTAITQMVIVGRNLQGVIQKRKRCAFRKAHLKSRYNTHVLK